MKVNEEVDSSYPFMDSTTTIIPESNPTPTVQYRGLIYIPNLTQSISKTFAEHNGDVKVGPKPPFRCFKNRGVCIKH